MTEKKCPECGIDIPDQEAVFCSKCGTSLTAKESEMDASDLELEDKSPKEEAPDEDASCEDEAKEPAGADGKDAAVESGTEPAADTEPATQPDPAPAAADEPPAEPEAAATVEGLAEESESAAADESPAQPRSSVPASVPEHAEPSHQASALENESPAQQRSVAGPVIGGIVVGLLLGGVCGCLVQKAMDDKNYGEKIANLEQQLDDTEARYEESQQKADEYERQHEEIKNILDGIGNGNSNANDEGKVNIGGFWVGDTPYNSDSSNSNADATDSGKSGSSESKAGEQPGVLGVRLSTNPDDAAKVVAFSRDSVAKDAGMKIGDVIIAIDGAPVAKSEEVVDLIAKHKQGDAVEIQTESGNTYKVTLG